MLLTFLILIQTREYYSVEERPKKETSGNTAKVVLEQQNDIIVNKLDAKKYCLFISFKSSQSLIFLTNIFEEKQ